ncbi:MAG: hypothetical protein JW810_11615 [Sedimentisphaerales bacterium]|nr:hypothetical protein [Sedimentisphaerales bacterium]
MKAERRHQLKTNELAQKLSELPAYLREHGKYLVLVVVGLVVVLVIAGFVWRQRGRSAQKQNQQLQQAFADFSDLQAQAMQRARIEPAEEDAPVTISATYDPAAVVGSLQQLSQEAQGKPIRMTSLLQEAEVVRSELFLSTRPLPQAQKEQIRQKAGQLYRQVIQEYATYPVAVGLARLGLAELAEDEGNWREAESVYREISEDKDGFYAGTSLPAQAKHRLNMATENARPLRMDLLVVKGPQESLAAVPLGGMDAAGTASPQMNAAEEVPYGPLPQGSTDSVEPAKPDESTEPAASDAPDEASDAGDNPQP